MPAKRAHKKSRNGCATCRARRVKCDEVYPSCGPCKKHDVLCDYGRGPPPSRRLHPLGKRSPDIMQWPNELFNVESIPEIRRNTSEMLELQLMSHFTVMHGTNVRPGYEQLSFMWCYKVPQRAVECDFLMYAVLSFAALDLHLRQPADARMQVVAHTYFGMAVQLFKKQLSNIVPENADAAFAVGIIIQHQILRGWKDPCGQGARGYRPPVSWLRLRRGISMVLQGIPVDTQRSCMKPLLQPSGDPMHHTEELTSLKYAEQFEPFGWVLGQDNSPDGLMLEGTYNTIHSLYQSYIKNGNIEPLRWRLLSFPGRLDSQFIELLDAFDFRAMIILSYYFAITKQIEDFVWFRGRSEYEINSVYHVLGDELKQYMRWPRSVVGFYDETTRSDIY